MFADASHAQVMNTATAKAVTIFNHVKIIIFVVGGFGLVGIAFQAIFGKVKWTWFAGLAVGMAILAAAASIVNYATGDVMGKNSNGEQVQDTFEGAGTGIAGGGGVCAFFKNGEIYKKVPFAEAEKEFLKEIEKLVN
jgi:hypothetical protein